MAAGGNDVTESSIDDAAADRKLSVAGESREQEAANDRKWNDVSKDGVDMGTSIMGDNSTSSTVTDTEQRTRVLLL